MNKVVSFGEIMLRLSPPGQSRMIQADRFDAVFGGSEANVAVALANLGLYTSFITKLPQNELGRAAENSLRRFGVDTTNTVKGTGRLGIYFLEKGADHRPSKVIYDRTGSAFSLASKKDFDWENILSGAQWFHFSGITPAISENACSITLDALHTAKALGLTVSCDLNYRSALWDYETAGRILSPMMEFTDVLIANTDHLKKIFAIEASTCGNADQAAELAAKKFSLKQVALTFRRTISADRNQFGAILFENSQTYRSKTYTIDIVDRVGGGDSFSAGLIYSNIKRMRPKEAVEFAAAAGCLKHSIEGDFGLFSAEEVESLAEGSTDGRVQR